ncbi:MAG: spore maturation protein A [Ruminococcaceae bacterium]|nr:spore maturation protein A [Oscillospiraceae bacterium]
MKVILLVIPVISMIFAALSGRMSELSSSIIVKSGEAVELVISLCGVMCFWCGLMRVAERAGLTEKLARLLSPIVCALFNGVPKGSKAVGLITMNLAANILGLGNASTPLGIAAMRELAENSEATDNMILLAVLNTASLQIIPATAAALRAANGAENPFDILPCVWIVSVYAAAVAVVSAKIMAKFARKREKH